MCGNDSKEKWYIPTENLKSQDDEEDEHGNAQHDDIFYDGEIPYEVWKQDIVHENVILLE